MLPVFVRPGSILPIAPLVQSTQEQPQGPLTLRVFPGPQCSGGLYQDDGLSFAYKTGDFLRMSFTCEVSEASGEVAIHIGKHEGGFPAWWRQIEVELDGVTGQARSVTSNGRPVPSHPGDRGLLIPVDDTGAGIDIVIR